MSGNGIKFGECLMGLLAARGWSAAKLAGLLGIDASYLRRWLRGERTPALHSSYVEQITNALCEGLDKEYKKSARAALQEFIEKAGAQIDVSIHASVQELLQNAQIHSLSLDSESRKVHKAQDGPRHSAELLKNFGRNAASYTAIKDDQSKSFTMLKIPKAIQGREAFLKSAISMLKQALAEESISAEGGELLMTFQSERDYFDGYSDLQHHWNQTIIQALAKGWTVKHVCRLTKNVERSFRLVNQIMDWTNYNGSYSLYYFNKYGVNNPPIEMILIKGKAALLGVAAGHHREVGAGLYVSGSEAYVLEQYAEQLFEEAEPLLKFLNPEEYFELNPEKDRKGGNQLLYMQDLSFLTLPYDVMDKYLHISIPNEQERSVHLNRIADSLQFFYRDIQQYKMQHIYPMRVIEQLVQQRAYAANYYFRPSVEDIVGHIEHLIELLQTYDKFEIALVDENQSDLLNHAEWDIKGNHTLTIGIMPRLESDTRVELLAITEGTLISAFQLHFEQLWERINPIHRDKAFIIAWLRERLEQFASKISR